MADATVAAPVGQIHKPGDLISVERLGRAEAPDPGSRPVVVYYVYYWSAASGGSKIAAKFFLPEGEPPYAGWPVSLYCHGLGDPGQVFRRWPTTSDPWRGAFGMRAGSWAHSGYATFVPWMPGAGDSEPLMTYSPLSLNRNARAVLDGFAALRQLSARLRDMNEIPANRADDPLLNFDRQVIRTNCVSSALLVHLLGHFGRDPLLAGLRALVADDFQPSVAYDLSYIRPFVEKLRPRLCAGVSVIRSRISWALACEQGWPLTELFDPRAIELFGEMVSTPVGPRQRIFNTLLLNPMKSELGNIYYEAACRSLGREPTGRELCDWGSSPAVIDLANQRDLRRILEHPLYRKCFAASDPFFAENIQPFEPGVPLFVIVRDSGAEDLASSVGFLPKLEERVTNMIQPKVETLRSWGWEVELMRFSAFEGTSYSGYLTQTAVLKRLADIV
ncbi:MAG: hypothetical protein QOK29_69 [Rhodospirillaceae bacterium]|jgi:hypothetical protein|nr:hypothetical protein [Rhodospirillaceae bacterium]